MIKKYEKDEKIIKKAFNLFFLLFLFIGGLSGGTTAVFYRSQFMSRINEIKQHEVQHVELMAEHVVDMVGIIIEDLSFLTGLNETSDYLTTPSSRSRSLITNEFAKLSEVRKSYDRIRLVDENGMEIISVDYKDDGLFVAPPETLKTIGGSYYFKETIRLGMNEIFVSPFDLNVENRGSETSLISIIRCGIPVFNDYGEKKGVVIIDFMGIKILNRIKEHDKVSLGSPMLINEDGWWILGENPDDEWGFMIESRNGRNIKNVYPDVYEAILKMKQGQILNGDGLFTIKKVYPLKAIEYYKTSTIDNNNDQYDDGSGYAWIFLSRVSKKIIDKYSRELIGRIFFIGASLFIVIAFGAWYLALSVTRKRIYQAQLLGMALYDALTGLPNRRLFFERLDSALYASKRYDRLFGILYLDLDGFKAVNDTMGHDAGDELLVKVSHFIASSLRKTDTVARMGGDEFAVILSEIRNRKSCETVAKKIRAGLSEPFHLKAGTAKIGVSIGISIYPLHGVTQESLLKTADQAMYMAKNSGKSQWCFADECKIDPNA